MQSIVIDKGDTRSLDYTSYIQQSHGLCQASCPFFTHALRAESPILFARETDLVRTSS